MTHRRKVCGRFDDLPAEARLTICSVYVELGQGVEEYIALVAGDNADPIVALPRAVFVDAVHHAYHHELEEIDGAS